MQAGSSETLIVWKSKNHLRPSMGPNEGGKAMDSGSKDLRLNTSALKD